MRKLLSQQDLVILADTAIFLMINKIPWRCKWLDCLMLLFTHLGEGWILLLILSSFRYAGGFAGPWYEHSFHAIVASGAVCQTIKNYFPKARPACVMPEVNILGKKLTAGSFPSGHTTTAFAVATVFSYHWPEITQIVYLLAAVVGISRIYVGAHFPLDVFFGAFLGLSVAGSIIVFMAAAPEVGIESPDAIILIFSFALILLSLPRIIRG